MGWSAPPPSVPHPHSGRAVSRRGPRILLPNLRECSWIEQDRQQASESTTDARRLFIVAKQVTGALVRRHDHTAPKTVRGWNARALGETTRHTPSQMNTKAASGVYRPRKNQAIKLFGASDTLDSFIPKHQLQLYTSFTCLVWIAVFSIGAPLGRLK